MASRQRTEAGWESLSPNYRARIERTVGKQGWLSGAKLGTARGHKTPPGIGEKAYANLIKLAKGLSWHADDTPKQVVDDELARGTKPRWLRERLTQRQADTRAYRRGNPTPGRDHWAKRRQSVPHQLYWYH